MKLHLFVILLFSFLFNKSLSAQAVDFSLSSYNIVIAEIAGSSFQEMKNVGHFPMSENPKAFLEYFLPTLKSIAEA